MTFLNLFAGIGGFRRGMELAGHGIIAWQPLPPAYQQNICGKADCPYNDGKECPAWNGCGGYEPKGE